MEKQIISSLISHCCNKLGINKPNKVTLVYNDNYTKQYKSFGGYIPNERHIYVVLKGRNMADICRTMSHELYHMYQDDNNLLNNSSGEDGSEHENQANSFSGEIMREFGRQNPQIYTITL